MLVHSCITVTPLVELALNAMEGKQMPRSSNCTGVTSEKN
jgi:hypothetical protein